MFLDWQYTAYSCCILREIWSLIIYITWHHNLFIMETINIDIVIELLKMGASSNFCDQVPATTNHNFLNLCSETAESIIHSIYGRVIIFLCWILY